MQFNHVFNLFIYVSMRECVQQMFNQMLIPQSQA